jgi:putative ABC transport system substrate-binding protein
MEFPVKNQFQWIQRFLPKCRTIGVIYNPEENQKMIDVASRTAKQMGLRLDAQKVYAPSDLPKALRNLSKSADVIWGVADKIVLTPQTAKNILLFSFRNRIPFVGLSKNWVKAGALYALSCDYSDLGLQSGEIAFKVLKGSPIKSIPPARPRKVMYSLNQKTARHMKIEIPEALIRSAKEVF